MAKGSAQRTVSRVALCLILAAFTFAARADAANAVQHQSSSIGGGTPILEFWPQAFIRGDVAARVAAIPLLRDEELKQFKVLYFTKLGEGMDVAVVDERMAAAFQEYDRSQDRAALMEDLHEIQRLLNEYRAPPYTKDQFVYVAMGASITQGGGASPASQGWVYTVADRLGKIHPDARVRNLAVGGTTTQHARDVQLPDVLKCHPDLVTYTAGINDLQYGVPVETVRDNTDYVLRELTERTDVKIVMTLMPEGLRFPAFTLDLPNLEERKIHLRPERVEQFNAVFRELAATYDVQLVDIGGLLEGCSGDDEIDKLFSFDGAHPNNAGHAKIADIFWAAIEQATAAPDKSGRSVWDLSSIRTLPLDIEVLSETRSEAEGRQYLEREILYTSQITDGKPVRAQAYLTIPLGASKPLPALVSIRALWGPSHKDNSVGYAREYGVVSLGVHLPEGESKAVWPEGFAEVTDHEKDYEKSYFYVLANAVMRGVTYLETLPEVNPDRIGVTGFSRGGMAAIIVNGVDDRIRASIPIAATGFSPEGLHRLRALYPDRKLTGSASRFNPLDYAITQHGATFMIVGAQDPIIPYAEAAYTFGAIPCEKRFEAVFNWGHGNYIADPAAETEFGESAEKKESRFKLNTKEAIESWLFDKEPLPDSPTVESQAHGDACSFVANIDPKGATRTLLVYSTDGGRTFKKVNMTGDGARRATTVRIPGEQQSGMTYYVEVEYGGRCFLSSPPVMGEDFDEKG